MTNPHTTTDTELDCNAAEQATAFVNITRKAQKATLQAILQEAFALAQGVPNAISRLQELIAAHKESAYRDVKNRLQYFVDILSAPELSCIVIRLGWRGRTMKACSFACHERIELSASGGGYNFADNLVSRALNKNKEFLKFLIKNPDFPRVSFYAGIPYFEYECLGDFAFCDEMKKRGWQNASYHLSFAHDYDGALARVYLAKNN